MTDQNKQAQSIPEESNAASGQSREARNLDRSLVQGVAWTVGVKWSSQIITWAATLIVARTLSPDDYGLFAMATVFTSLVEMISDFGMGTAIVKHQDLTTKQIAQINGLCVLLGLTGWALTCLAAYPLSLFFHTPALVAVVMTLGAAFFITAFRIVPLSLLQRDLQFRSAAINDGSQAILLSVAMVALAISGFQYWALVFGNLLSGLLTTLLACRLRPMSFAWPRYQEIKEALTFGGHMVVLRFCWYITSTADQLVAGKVLGQRALGGYSIAQTIAGLPMEKLTSVVMRVLPSIISTVQDDTTALRRYVLRFTEGLSVVTMPAAVGLALVADDLVHVALGDAWLIAILPLQLFSLSVAYRSTLPILPSVAAIVGLSRIIMRISIVTAIVLPIAFLIGSRWGIGGIAAVWLIVYPILVIPYFLVVFRRIDMRSYEYLRALWPAASSTAVMAAVVYGAHQFFYMHSPVALRLATEIVLGVLSYSIFFITFHRKRATALKDIFRMMRSK
jgi:teichuronic acid exporter